MNTKKPYKDLKFVNVKRSSAAEIIPKEELPWRIHRPDSVGGEHVEVEIVDSPKALKIDKIDESSDTDAEIIDTAYKNVLGLRKV